MLVCQSCGGFVRAWNDHMRRSAFTCSREPKAVRANESDVCLECGHIRRAHGVAGCRSRSSSPGVSECSCDVHAGSMTDFTPKSEISATPSPITPRTEGTMTQVTRTPEVSAAIDALVKAREALRAEWTEKDRKRVQANTARDAAQRAAEVAQAVWRVTVTDLNSTENSLRALGFDVEAMDDDQGEDVFE